MPLGRINRLSRAAGGTGRRARLRGVWGNPSGFESRVAHHRAGGPDATMPAVRYRPLVIGALANRREAILIVILAPAYIALDSVLGSLADGTLASPSEFVSLWSASWEGDVFFVVGSLGALAFGVFVKGKRAIVFAVLITWATYSVAATAALSLPTFGEGSASPPGFQNLGYWLVFTPVVGIIGIVFCAAAVVALRRWRVGDSHAP
jgi:hypothetical protein